MWETHDELHLSDLCKLQLLNIRAWGCAKLLNARLRKPAETACVAIPPATATLKQFPAGDRVLIVTMNTALLHQVCLRPMPRAFVPLSCSQC